ncbi:hypothetical protein E2P81_ATG10866 [Venturia nashicola]|uniref:Uncharacterized protein n=1 Tax=Venturia nashicola TaxID=86259 RepID=A0A4Z1P772_9PEZI|nr:hypothetical protein E6O75_ATG10538 [Venturia nashicola]TLD27578.1 hypothetical protein E2P81_ATG10866 [Venturia nashicola]
MLSRSSILLQCISFLSLTSSVTAVPANEPSRSPWSSHSQVARATTAKPPLILTTEKQTECNEFPDPGYGGADPPLYKFFPEEEKITAACWTEQKVNRKTQTYIRTTLGCYMHEDSLQSENKDLQRLLPECVKIIPYKVKTTRNEYLLPKDGFLMNCYAKPDLGSRKLEVQWGARHVLCSVRGEKVGESDVWWRDAHVQGVNMTGVQLKSWTKESKMAERGHCYVPEDAFDSTVFEVKGGGGVCSEGPL